MEKYLFIINEHSKRGKRAPKIIEKVMDKKGLPYRMIKTSDENQGTYLFERFALEEDDQTLLVAVGGDGILNQAVTGLQQAGNDRALGYLPAGSGNDFARSVGMTSDTQAALEALLDLDQPQARDIIKFSDGKTTHYAVNSLGVGIDSLAIYYIYQSRQSKSFLRARMPSQLNYLSSAIRAFFDQEGYALSLAIDGDFLTLEDVQLFGVFNHPYFGAGIALSPNSTSLDRKLEVLVFKDVSKGEFAQLVSSVLTTKDHLNHDKVLTYSVDQLQFYLEEAYGQKDGELFSADRRIFQVEIAQQKFYLP